ncbi:Isoleucine--tRNA ligase [Phycisphaerae bacterium RAS1]|nr:Isoleucine--tRNA ligase [Phycisphaerae bacterium RAS1]
MFEPLPSKFSFPESEKRILAFWDEQDVFHRSLELRKDAPRFVFYEGPPTANGLPHPGHCLTRAIKDIFPRYKTMCGFLVERKAGWDTHGLPVEVEVCKELGIHTKEEIEKFGVEKFVLRCIESVFRYTKQWEDLTHRLGFWVNLKDAYVTYHQSYVESVWWSLKTLFDRGLLYQGHKVVWWWCQGGTALSAGEVGEGYRTVDDPSVFVKFRLADSGGMGVGGTGVSPVQAGGTGVSPVQAGGTGVSPVPAAGVSEKLTIRQRHLPHWEAGGNTYFITFRTSGVRKNADGTVRSSELSEAERDAVLSACVHFDATRMLVHSVVVMPDHVHMLITPLEKSPGVWWSLAELLHSVKSFSGKQIADLRRAAGAAGDAAVWQDEYFDRIIRTQSDFDEKRAYIFGNPAKRGLDLTYKWVWDEAATERRVEGQVARDGRDARPTHAGNARVSLLVWTTTPWTLVSNHFAAVHPGLDYALVHDPVDNEHLYIAAAMVESIAKKVKRELTVVSTCKGSDLVGRRYQPPFDCYAKTLGDTTAKLMAGGEASVGWRVLAADFVTLESGTGLVHEAPAFGEVDFNLLQEERSHFVDFDAIPLLCAVNPDGTFNADAPEKYRGRWIKECDKEITRELKERGLLYHQEQHRHEYPFCPRAENDPLIQYARKSWFVRTSRFKDEFLKNNAAVQWLPEHIREGRFGDFLRNNVDWALSRERYWGTPLPIWVCEKTGRMESIGSFDELQKKPGATDGGFWDRKCAEAAAAGHPLPEHLRVHKPYIDEWTYDSPFDKGTGNREQGTESRARMRRVTEVIDCWWDAGSMPFAQWGFPHSPGSVEQVSRRWPADFISEAIDQTRGWFYGLLSISTLLREPIRSLSGAAGEFPLPYKTCIVLGHIAGEDGNKMSKRLRNYKEPSYIFDTLGADAMRWYFFSGQAPWTSTRFTEANIRDSQREFLVKLYNVLSFFTIYANIDGFCSVGRAHHCWQGTGNREQGTGTAGVANPTAAVGSSHPTGFRPVAQRGELDRWIISELHRTIAFVRAKMDAFENFPAAGRINDFVDALSNWYVRRSRDRFWSAVGETGTGGTGVSPVVNQDKWDAYNTLYECLTTLSRLIAPFTPFFAEMMFQNLEGNGEQGTGNREQGTENSKAHVPTFPHFHFPTMVLSVHLCDYPQHDASLIDEKLAAEMDLVRQIVSTGRAARAGAKVKVRQPLAQVEVVLARHEHESWLDAHKALIAEELNVKKVEFIRSADHYVSYTIKPDFKAIGPKFGKIAPAISAALAKLDAADARTALLSSDRLTLDVNGQSVTLTKQDVDVRLEARPGWSAAQDAAAVVVVSTEISPELRDEGVIREFIHHIQAARKDLDLPYQARIAVHLEAEPAFSETVRRFDALLRSECLADRIEFAIPAQVSAAALSVEGAPVRLAVTRLA